MQQYCARPNNDHNNNNIQLISTQYNIQTSQHLGGVIYAQK